MPDITLEQKLVIRELDKPDIKDILDIRVSTTENHFSMTDLAEVGVTPEAISDWLWSDPDPGIRAYGFYRKLGYEPTGVTKGNDEMLKLKRKMSETA